MSKARDARDKADIEATWPERCPVCGVEWTVTLGRKTARCIEWRCNACGWHQMFIRPSAKKEAEHEQRHPVA